MSGCFKPRTDVKQTEPELLRGIRPRGADGSTTRVRPMSPASHAEPVDKPPLVNDAYCCRFVTHSGKTRQEVCRRRHAQGVFCMASGRPEHVAFPRVAAVSGLERPPTSSARTTNLQRESGRRSSGYALSLARHVSRRAASQLGPGNSIVTWTHLESSFVVEDGHHGVCKSRAAGNSPSPAVLKPAVQGWQRQRWAQLLVAVQHRSRALPLHPLLRGTAGELPTPAKLNQSANKGLIPALPRHSPLARTCVHTWATFTNQPSDAGAERRSEKLTDGRNGGTSLEARAAHE